MKQSQTRRQTTPIAPVSEDIHDLKRLDPLPAFRASFPVRSVLVFVAIGAVELLLLSGTLLKACAN